MTIENRNLTVGTKLVGKYHKQQHTCQVIQGEGYKLRYPLEDGREFKSPSAAEMAVTGHACDGWHFWSVETNANPPINETPTEVNTRFRRQYQGGIHVCHCCQDGQCSGDGNCSGCPGINHSQDDLQAHAQPERGRGRPDQMVLQGMRREFSSSLLRGSHKLSSRSQSLVLTNQVSTQQAPLFGSLICFVTMGITIPSISRGNEW